jgi:hypothetical protein
MLTVYDDDAGEDADEDVDEDVFSAEAELSTFCAACPAPVDCDRFGPTDWIDIVLSKKVVP